MRRFMLVGATLALMASSTAGAGAFAVAPIRVEFHGGERTAVLTLRNEADAPTVIQLRQVVWTQTGGADQYEDTRDLLVTPPIFTLPEKGEQIIRVALRRGADPNRELAYRLFIQEVPASANQSKMQLNVALRLSLPVFVPAVAKTLNVVQWRATWLPDGRLQLDATNAGNVHVQLTDFSVTVGEGAHVGGSNVARYLLPGTSSQWVLEAPTGSDRTAAIMVRGHSDQGDFSATVRTVT